MSNELDTDLSNLSYAKLEVTLLDNPEQQTVEMMLNYGSYNNDKFSQTVKVVMECNTPEEMHETGALKDAPINDILGVLIAKLLDSNWSTLVATALVARGEDPSKHDSYRVLKDGTIFRNPLTDDSVH
jgi:hypothetical protein